jgi:hypothetical protein
VRLSFGCRAVRDWLQAGEFEKAKSPSRAPFDFAQDEQRAAPLGIHNRQKTAEGNVQGRWEAGGSQTRPYVVVKSAARICRAMRMSSEGSGPPKGGP